MATIINAIWAWILISSGRSAKSPALVADGQHIMTDVVTSVGVFGGLVGAVLTGWQILDPALAVIVALNILWQGWHVIGSSMNRLLNSGKKAGKEGFMAFIQIVEFRSSQRAEVERLSHQYEEDTNDTRTSDRATL